MDDAFDVPDPTDWLGTPLAGLMPVEQAFRCHVCKDFFNSPMLTSCNHTFCSICIRRCLLMDGKCPLCRANDQESKLRGNWALREAVDAFVKARDNMIRLARTPAVAPSSPKRKATEVDGHEENSQETKRPRMSTRSSKAKAAEATAAMMRDEFDVPDESWDFEPEPEPDDGLAACPICWTRMKPWQVDKHIDTACPGSPQPQPPQPAISSSRNTSKDFKLASSHSASPAPSNPPERLPALAYSMLNDTRLRKKMTDLGLSTAGTRQALERRHQEWVTIWNANCDSAKPKRRSELLHDLDVWEKTVGSRAPVMSRAAVVGAQIKDKDFDAAAWAARHDSSFKDLIANAKRSRTQVEQKAKEPSTAEEKQSDSALPITGNYPAFVNKG
ncbi:hypothetical protein B0H66DRAFT_263772 [Apodospora peruviana]|uniref:Postreplication repair E3 ubiquitin-protein ligase RAD18 n=1 Tax=Apodospora peruviana TaxID=516989 RepID=A0AAE0M4N3_9PEZI|nr:hypothetical protein B0H66DRAFT_263772 [Apodospora peruviana]